MRTTIVTAVIAAGLALGHGLALAQKAWPETIAWFRRYLGA